jgi:hypothetical protein
VIRTRRRQEHYIPQKNNSIEDLGGNEYSVPDPNKTMLNVTNEPTEVHKKDL